MADDTSRHALPLLQPGQAQKELYHNEALARIDALLHPAVEAVGATQPPAAPKLGQCWATGAAPGEAWRGHGLALACWTDGGWRFVAGRDGMSVWSAGDGAVAWWSAAGWRLGEVAARAVVVRGQQVVGARRPAIADPAGGTAADGEARAAILAILSALREHGLIAR